MDLLFPNEEVPLGRVLANIASRGTLYGLVVTQLSEEHRSVTVNILYGQTQGEYIFPFTFFFLCRVMMFNRTFSLF